MRNLVAFWGLMSALVCGLCGQDERGWKSPVPTATDCSHFKALSPGARSGEYLIQPAGTLLPFKVYCEILPDGGWTVFQRRSGSEVSFQRRWASYKNGFGSLMGDHWLGLSKLHSLTKNRTTRWTMRVDLWDHEEGTAFAEYSNFMVDSESKAFKLRVGAFQGNAGDAIRGAYPGINQNGFGFSTVDRDNDGCSPCIFGDIATNECSPSKGGGWWFSKCGSANLNGDWHPAGNHIGWASGLHWHTWKKPIPYSMRATRMMIRPA